MNYFAHGCRYIDDPYFLAGTAVPDWLSVVDRRVRVRPKDAAALADDADDRAARVARGIARHHADDGWFHVGATFAELCWRYTVAIRDLLPGDDGLRPSFLGHILIEILLDAALIERRPQLLDDYYRAMESLDAGVVEAAVSRMATAPPDGLSLLIPAFTRERFLCDYADDRRLLRRLNQVMRRVRLEPLPERFLELLPTLRREVAARRSELLSEEWA